MSETTSVPAQHRKGTSIAVLSVTALLPALAVLAYDCIARREMFVHRAGPPVGWYIGGAVLSIGVWVALLEGARHPSRPARVGVLALVGLTAFFGIGGQLLFQATAHEYYNRDAVLFSIQ